MHACASCMAECHLCISLPRVSLPHQHLEHTHALMHKVAHISLDARLRPTTAPLILTIASDETYLVPNIN